MVSFGEKSKLDFFYTHRIFSIIYILEIINFVFFLQCFDVAIKLLIMIHAPKLTHWHVEKVSSYTQSNLVPFKSYLTYTHSSSSKWQKSLFFNACPQIQHGFNYSQIKKAFAWWVLIYVYAMMMMISVA